MVWSFACITILSCTDLHVTSLSFWSLVWIVSCSCIAHFIDVFYHGLELDLGLDSGLDLKVGRLCRGLDHISIMAGHIHSHTRGPFRGNKGTLLNAFIDKEGNPMKEKSAGG